MDGSGLRVLIASTLGEIVAPRSPQAIAGAIATLRASSPDREAGGVRARHRYGVTGTVDSYAALFDEVARPAQHG